MLVTLARSKRSYRRKWPLTACVLLRAVVEVMIVLIGQMGGQRVAVNRVGGDPCQRRLFRLATRTYNPSVNSKPRLTLQTRGLEEPEAAFRVNWRDSGGTLERAHLRSR